MKVGIVKAAWYPIYQIVHEIDDIFKADVPVEVSQELQDRNERTYQSFVAAQEEIAVLYKKAGGR